MQDGYNMGNLNMTALTTAVVEAAARDVKYNMSASNE